MALRFDRESCAAFLDCPQGQGNILGILGKDNTRWGVGIEFLVPVAGTTVDVSKIQLAQGCFLDSQRGSQGLACDRLVLEETENTQHARAHRQSNCEKSDERHGEGIQMARVQLRPHVITYQDRRGLI